MPKLLIVDDAAADRVRISGIAARWLDCTVLQANDGAAAIRQIQTQIPDIVLTDMHMPEMNGLELLATIKSEYPNIPVILMTGVGSEEIAAQALRDGAASYVPKNRLAEDLVNTLKQVHSTAEMAHTQSRLMHYLQDSVVTFELTNDPALLRLCVNHLLSMLRCLPLGDESERLRMGIALQEALDNACYHGNLEISTADYRSANCGEIVAARLWAKPYLQRQITIRAAISRERAEFVISDEGSGFDTALADFGEALPAQDASFGRGIRLMQSIMDDVIFNTTGNVVTMIRYAIETDDD